MAQLPSESLFGDYSEWPGRDVLDSGGERLGGVREIYLDRETGHPEWVLVDVENDTARFVPLADASVGSATIRVAHSASEIRNAPGIGAEAQIDQAEERRLYAHYGLGYSEDDSGSGLPDGPGARGRGARDRLLERGGRGAAVEPRPAAGRAAVARGDRGRAEIREPSAAGAAGRRRSWRPSPMTAVPSAGRADRRSGRGLRARRDAVAPSSAGEILAAAPEAEDLKAQPGPDAVRPVTPLEPPRPQQPPPPRAGDLVRPARRRRGAQAGDRRRGRDRGRPVPRDSQAPLTARAAVQAA